MSLERLRAICDAYGGDPLRWPDAERAAALELLARSVDARQLHEQALRLDAALDLLPAAEPSVELEDRIVAAALLDRTAPQRSAAVRPIGDARRARRLRTGLLAAALPVAAAAALALWIGNGRGVKTPTTTPADVASADIQLADLGVYQVPGDELLAVSVLDDAYDAEPLHGCSDGELGCLQVETLALEPLSRDDKPVEEVRFLS